MKAETVVLGRGPIGIFTSYKLIKNGYSVLNIDAGIQIKNLKKSLKVSSNVDWKSKRQAPSFNIEGSDYHWGGGCMGWPLIDNYLNEQEFLESDERIKEYLNIKDFDFLNNKPIIEKSIDSNIDQDKKIIYTYLYSNIDFRDKITFLENSSNYTFKDGVIAKNIEAQDELIKINILNNKNENSIIEAKKLFLCLGGIENSRILQNSKNKLAISNRSLLKNLNDHLRLKIGKVEVSNFYSFKKIFDKVKNDKNEKYLWPRYLLDSEEIKSYVYFKNWRYNNIFLRRLSNDRFKRYFKASGSCDVYLFIEKLNDSETYQKINQNREESFEVNFFLSDNEISKINEQILKYKDNMIKDFASFQLKFKKIVNINNKNRSLIISSNHPSGSTPMGSDAKNSIINYQSQLWSHRNIFIYGSSTFKRPHYIHPTYPSLVFADISLSKQKKSNI